jgi:predicted RNA-binding Zn ribbon-like protein
MDPAPGPLALVQDLLNTHSAGTSVDLLDDLGDAQDWLAGALAGWALATGRPAPEIALTAPDLHQVRAFRAELGRLVGSTPGPADAPVLRAATTTVSLGADGVVRTEPRGAGWRGLVSLVLIEIGAAQAVDEWRRLKTCRNTECAVSFYDRSRNNSGVWHDVHTCGNAQNLRAYRARQKVRADQ